MDKELKEEKQEWINLLDMFKNQQKEFIEYLKNKRDEYAENLEYWSSELISITLSKYKEIIGNVKNEKN